MSLLFEQINVVEGWKPQTMGSGAASDWVSLMNYSGAIAVITITQGHASEGDITVDKAQTSAGGTNSDGITVKYLWSNVDTPTGDWTKATAAAAFNTSATGSGSSLYVLDIRADDLGEGYDYFQVNLASSSASNISACVIIPYGARYPQAQPVDSTV